jgi:hypothetical protein
MASVRTTTSGHTSKRAAKQLGTLQKALAEANEIAHQWKEVADTRLHYLSVLDHSLSNFLEAMIEVGSIFDLQIKDPKLRRSHVDVDSGAEIHDLASKKAVILMRYVDQLAAEAAHVQTTLESVLELATQAIAVTTPTADIGPVKRREPITMKTLADELAAIEEDESDDDGDSEEDEVTARDYGNDSESEEIPLRDSAIVLSRKSHMDIFK